LGNKSKTCRNAVGPSLEAQPAQATVWVKRKISSLVLLDMLFIRFCFLIVLRMNINNHYDTKNSQSAKYDEKGINILSPNCIYFRLSE
jgi:hypothetical protein